MQSVDSDREVSLRSGQHARWCCRRWPEHAIQRRWCRSRSPRVATTFRLRCESALRSRSRFSGGRARIPPRWLRCASPFVAKAMWRASKWEPPRRFLRSSVDFGGARSRSARSPARAQGGRADSSDWREDLAEDSGHQGRCRSRSNGGSRRRRQRAARRSSIVDFAARRSRATARLDRIIGGRGSTAQRIRAANGHDSISAGAFALFAGRPFAYFVGPSLAGSLGLLPRMSLRIEADGTFGSLQQPDRTLHMRGAAGATTLLFAGHAGSLLWTIGAGGRIGLMQLSGDAASTAPVVGKTASGLWAGPVIAGSRPIRSRHRVGSSRWAPRVASWRFRWVR